MALRQQHRQRLSLSASGTLAMLVLSFTTTQVYAYLSPEQVFGGGQIASSASIPIPFGASTSSSSTHSTYSSIPIPFGGQSSSSVSGQNYTSIPIPFGGSTISSSSSVSSTSSSSVSSSSASSGAGTQTSSSPSWSAPSLPYTPSQVGTYSTTVYMSQPQYSYTLPPSNATIELSFRDASPDRGPQSGRQQAQGQVLHSGAPIAQTGPDDAMMAVALMLAGLGTGYAVQRRSRMYR